MKPITKERQQALIELANIELSEWELSSDHALLIEIALASLTAEPICWEIAGCIFSTEAEALKPGFRGTPEPLYEYPPVQVIKCPQEADESNLPFAALGWNACIDEIKRLNGLGE